MSVSPLPDGSTIISNHDHLGAFTSPPLYPLLLTYNVCQFFCELVSFSIIMTLWVNNNWFSKNYRPVISTSLSSM
jgi:hypothetical protein